MPLNVLQTCGSTTRRKLRLVRVVLGSLRHLINADGPGCLARGHAWHRSSEIPACPFSNDLQLNGKAYLCNRSTPPTLWPQTIPVT